MNDYVGFRSLNPTYKIYKIGDRTDCYFNLNDFDHDGEVFGRPDQVEIDVILKNGLVILCEIKSSMSKGDLYIFHRKVAFYEKHHHRTVNRKLVICPMVDQRALPVAENLGIEIYSYAEDIVNL
jgi:hypothetical protein